MLCACGVYCLCDKAAQFKQEQEPGHSRGKVVVVHHGLHPLLPLRLGGGGHGGGGDDGNGDNGSGGDDARGHIAEAGQCDGDV